MSSAWSVVLAFSRPISKNYYGWIERPEAMIHATADLLRKHGAKTAEELKAERKMKRLLLMLTLAVLFFNF